MNKNEVVETLQRFKDRQFAKFLDESLPGESFKLDAKLHHIMLVRGRSESDVQVFWRQDGEPSVSFIDSLIIDVQNDEFDFDARPSKIVPQSTPNQALSNRVFIVHGHNELTKTKTARFIEKLGYEAVILHEQASRGMTIIEKREANTDVGFSIVLYTPDDQGNSNEGAKKGELKDRARQNVVFEHGYLIAKLGRERVVPLVCGQIELPGDISGVVYVDDKNWQFEIAKEMKSVGYSVDFNKIIS